MVTDWWGPLACLRVMSEEYSKSVSQERSPFTLGVMIIRAVIPSLQEKLLSIKQVRGLESSTMQSRLRYLTGLRRSLLLNAG
jgi:hypothetical protein